MCCLLSAKVRQHGVEGVRKHKFLPASYEKRQFEL